METDPATPAPPPPPPGKWTSYELMCGCARLSANLGLEGFVCVAVDRADNRHSPEVPWLRLDLSKPTDQNIFLQLLSEAAGSAFIIWFGIPCGTFSRAREKPIPEYLKAQGVPEPQPLRSE
eukprot:11122466-Heterocapsa_arctica.AAC.1